MDYSTGLYSEISASISQAFPPKRLLETATVRDFRTIRKERVGAGMTRLRDEHNQQKDILEVKVYKWRKEPHDRFLFIDDKLYHCCHSLNATGGKLSAIMLMETSTDLILNEMTRNS